MRGTNAIYYKPLETGDCYDGSDTASCSWPLTMLPVMWTKLEINVLSLLILVSGSWSNDWNQNVLMSNELEAIFLICRVKPSKWKDHF